ncbi:hypothetical protein COCON_G00002960 [Conger conger]|uniref:Uncharacterized protein n=1 Tax=Conger conger TaxID=82655 RepID=A0A9Q1I6I1_CONCO|nr:hypothetical protein COCON_G00002960 [Conger conger]
MMQHKDILLLAVIVTLCLPFICAIPPNWKMTCSFTTTEKQYPWDGFNQSKHISEAKCCKYGDLFQCTEKDIERSHIICESLQECGFQIKGEDFPSAACCKVKNQLPDSPSLSTHMTTTQAPYTLAPKERREKSQEGNDDGLPNGGSGLLLLISLMVTWYLH